VQDDQLMSFTSFAQQLFVDVFCTRRTRRDRTTAIAGGTTYEAMRVMLRVCGKWW
jgi:hypothetical protein